MQPYGLNYLPKEIIHLISQKLDFNSCRDLRLTCKDIYKNSQIKQPYSERAQSLFSMDKLYQPPTPQQLGHYNIKKAVSTGMHVTAGGIFTGIAGQLFGTCIPISGCATPGLVVCGISGAAFSGLLILRCFLFKDIGLEPEIPIIKPNYADMERLLGDNSSDGPTERRQHDLEVDADCELLPSASKLEI